MILASQDLTGPHSCQGVPGASSLLSLLCGLQVPSRQFATSPASPARREGLNRVFQGLWCSPGSFVTSPAAFPAPAQAYLLSTKTGFEWPAVFLICLIPQGACLWMEPWLLFCKYPGLGSTCSKIFSKVIQKCAHVHTHIQGIWIILIGFSFSALLRNTARKVESLISQKSNQQALLKNWHKQIGKKGKRNRKKKLHSDASPGVHLCFRSTSFKSELLLILLPSPPSWKPQSIFLK